MEPGGLSHEKAIEVNHRHHSTVFSCGSDGNMARDFQNDLDMLDHTERKRHGDFARAHQYR